MRIWVNGKGKGRFAEFYYCYYCPGMKARRGPQPLVLIPGFLPHLTHYRSWSRFQIPRQNCANSLEKQPMPLKHSTQNLGFHKLFRLADSFPSYVCCLRVGWMGRQTALKVLSMDQQKRSEHQIRNENWVLLLHLSATKINNLE